MSSASRSASPPASVSCSRTPSRHVRAAETVVRASGLPVLAGERLARLLGGRAQGVGEPEPALVGRQRGVLARLGGDRLDLAEPEAQQVGLLGPLPGVWRRPPRARARRRRGGGSRSAYVVSSAGDLLAAEPVERLALRPGLQQPVLVGLAVHGDERLGDLGERRDRHRGAADERAGAALGGDVAGQDDARRPRPRRPPRRRRRRSRSIPATRTTPSTRAVLRAGADRAACRHDHPAAARAR